MQAALESNLWKFTIYLITNKRTFMSILGVYLLTLPGATPKSIGIMLTLGNLSGFIMEIPSGYLADKIGHKRALVLAKVFLFISTFCFLVGANLYFFIVGMVLFNFGLAFDSGTKEAFMHNTLTALGKEKNYSRIMGKISSLGFGVPVIFIVLLPFLVSINFRAPFAIAMILDLVGLWAVLSLKQPPKTTAQIQEISNFKFSKIYAEGKRYGIFKYLWFLGIIAAIMMSSTGFRDVYQAFLGVPVIYYGVFWGISRLITAVALLYNGEVKKLLSLNQFLAVRLVVFGFLLLGLGLSTNPTIIVILYIFISAFGWSLSQAQAHYLLEKLAGSNFKATILSTKGFIVHALFALFALVVGIGITNYGYAPTFRYLALAFFVILGSLYGYILITERPAKKSRV